MTLRPSIPSILSMTLVLGCGAPEISTRKSAIVNGSPHNGHPPVGALLAGGGLCTATLVGTRTVLTAAHCVTPGAQHRFFVANQYWPVTSVARHPTYTTPVADNDVAVVRLEQEPPVTPASITTVPPGQGQQLTLLGYGATSQSGIGSGTKRIGTNRVAGLSSTRIFIAGSGGTDANLCFGDSGGPSFATIGGNEVLVGIHSTISGTCGQEGHDMRVDIFADWIRSTAGGDLSEDGNPSPFDDQEPPLVEITAPGDGQQLRGTVEVTATVTDNEKVTEVAFAVDGKVTATLSEPPFRFASALEPGAYRLAVVARDLAGNSGEAVVDVEVLPPLLFGEICGSNDECSTGLCGTQGGEAFCTRTCTPEEGCPEDAECLPAGQGQHACGLPGSALSDSAGCGVAGSQATAPATLLFLLLAVVGLVVRRR